MKFFLARDEPFTFLHNHSLQGYKGKWGQFKMKYQVNEWDLNRFDQRISNVLRKMADRCPPSNATFDCNMGVMLLLRDEPGRMRKGKLRLGRPEEEFLKDVAALYHQGNLRVKVTLSFPQTCDMLSDADNFADVTYAYISTKEMAVNVECPNRSCAIGSVRFCSADVHIPARFLCGASSIKAFLTVEVMLDTEYLRPPTPTKNDSPFEKMFNDQIHTDFTITAGNGKPIKCHKSVLSACSPVFGAMLETDMVEAKTHNVNIREMSETGVRSFLHFLYYSNQDVPMENCDIAFELLNAGHKYNVTPDLETAMSILILSKPSEWFTMDVAVNIFLFAENIPKYKEALKEKAIQVLKERDFTTFRNFETYVQMFRKYPAETMELYELLFGRLSGKPVDLKRRRWE